MIELTRLNGHKFSVNCDLIKYLEAAPDTTLTLITGEKLLVVEAREIVVELILRSRALLLRNAWPEGVRAQGAKLAFDASSEPHHNENTSFAVTP